MNIHEQYMYRCLELAGKGAGAVAPNPMVGAVLVYQDQIIGEGWHQQYGQAHAEVNCFKSVAPEDVPYIPESTLYVSLEPCAHYGKTPPCAELIVQHRVPQVVIACVDTFAQVAGKGIKILEAAGITVHTGVLEKEARALNKRFFTYHEKKRPYIILKWAQSADGYMAPEQGTKVMLSNALVQRFVHQMRSVEGAILVGYQTALKDNPYLTNRYFGKQQPLRLVIDAQNALPETLHLKTDGLQTIIYNHKSSLQFDALTYVPLAATSPLPEQIVKDLYQRGINSLIIEGGQKTLQQFLDANFWDEAFCIDTPVLLEQGTPAPQLAHALIHNSITLGDNIIKHYTRTHEYL
ncbi:bifunctional diaminohydroxyphosphoribosylaminopyrimidine deaminase/5-amino-6-(5-phosphoribosylamino)uracil reductase RibD [Taibaiella sp. KBW10]|uniref:bifunctional diaminohydroxyphosphoribosylaminopyrimidine deaminase/5-amino-6-(5-phosphoribosylamino)uracil reductase RibD n=1 Tax=Taibaiella sp. KBW10 TaxID=2153357 RepID=UPI0013151CB9|nr:bifunctional diaminohydroxyphosphoribosylaminopyrimidine deaminase/5-amino-6-(5-phosphoribosylamino)uracil reductase RibD [Taibaiella sp. KBW10]